MPERTEEASGNDPATQRQPFILYFRMVPSDKPCQVCETTTDTTSYQFLAADGIACQTHLGNLLEEVRKVLQIVPRDVFTLNLLTGEQKQIMRSVSQEVKAFNKLLSGVNINLGKVQP